MNCLFVSECYLSIIWLFVSKDFPLSLIIAFLFVLVIVFLYLFIFLQTCFFNYYYLFVFNNYFLPFFSLSLAIIIRINEQKCYLFIVSQNSLLYIRPWKHRRLVFFQHIENKWKKRNLEILGQKAE